MGVLSGLIGKAKAWFGNGRFPFSKEKTLGELMAERGLNEFGRTGQAPAQAKQKTSSSSYTVKFVAEFSSFEMPGNVRVSVVALDSREFQGFLEEGGELQAFSWGKVRGLMKIVDTGEMLSPYEAYDVYH